MTEVVTIYALSEGKGEPPRYVGKTALWLRERYRGHLYDARKGYRRPVCLWVRRLLLSGKEPYLKWLEQVGPSADWEERERYWISKFREEGCNLLNLTDGGEGQHGLRATPLQRARCSLRQRTKQARKCRACAKKFWRKQYQVAAGYDKFCSRRCHDDHRRGRHKPVPESCTAASAAARRAKTHCKRGHPLSGDNIYIYGSPHKAKRTCKQCFKSRKKERAASETNRDAA
jgi:hypothetical protein